jgi:hypothetical protein
MYNFINNKNHQTIDLGLLNINFSIRIWYQSLSRIKIQFYFFSFIMSSSSSISSESTSPQQLSHSNHFSPVKLGHDNYMVWTTQVVPYLEGLSLYGYVTGDIPAPAGTPTTFFMIANPAYTTWYQHDKLILNTLISTLSDAALPHVVGINIT